MTTIIGIHGKKHSGKSTVGAAISAEWRSNMIPHISIMFAEPLKRAAEAIFGWSMADMENDTFKATIDPRYGVTPRYALQTLGTEWGRDLIGADLWQNIARNRIQDAIKYQERVIVTDVRFENEAALIRNMGGTVIHVIDPHQVETDGHASEIPIQFHPGDGMFSNDKSAGLDPIRQYASLFV